MNDTPDIERETDIAGIDNARPNRDEELEDDERRARGETPEEDDATIGDEIESDEDVEDPDTE